MRFHKLLAKLNDSNSLKIFHLLTYICSYVGCSILPILLQLSIELVNVDLMLSHSALLMDNYWNNGHRANDVKKIVSKHYTAVMETLDIQNILYYLAFGCDLHWDSSVYPSGKASTYTSKTQPCDQLNSNYKPSSFKSY